MLAPSFAVKKTARTALRGKYVGALFAGAVFVFSWVVCVIIGGLLAKMCGTVVYYAAMIIAAVFLLSPLWLGVVYFYRRLAWGEKDNPAAVFRYFGSRRLYMRSLKLTGVILSKLVMVGIVLYIPALTLTLISSNRFYLAFGSTMPVWAPGLWIIASFLRVLASVALIFLSLKYYAAAFIVVADEDISPARAASISLAISRGTYSDFLWLVLSFLPLIIFSVFLLPLIFFMPYFVTSYVVHCRFAVASYNKAVDNLHSSTPFYSAEI